MPDTPADMEDAVVAILRSDADVSAMVDARIYPMDFPQNPVYPAIIFQVISRFHHAHMQGASGLARSRIQVDVYSQDYDTTKALAWKVKNAMHAFKGMVPVVDSAPVEVQGIFCTTERDMAESVIRQSGRKVRRRLQEFTVWV